MHKRITVYMLIGMSLPGLIRGVWIEDDEEFESLKSFIRSFDITQNPYSGHPHLPEFRRHKAISLIYSSNKLESTIPIGMSQMDTYKILDNVFSAVDIDANLHGQLWNSDGKDANGFRCQLYHNCIAYNYLCGENVSYSAPLTVERILTAHKLLMENAVCGGGNLVLNGQFRNFSVCADTYVYMRHEDIPREVELIVEKFNSNIANKCHPVIIAADLFYDLITAHPFQDGNGRLCRLMAAYAFFAAGVPIPVPITTGHKKSRNHYMRAILRARKFGGDRKLLYTLFATSLELAWTNLVQYCR